MSCARGRPAREARPAPGGARSATPHPSETVGGKAGLHPVDIAFAMGDLIARVQKPSAVGARRR